MGDHFVTIAVLTAGHVVVGQDDIGLLRTNLLDQFAGIGRKAHDIEAESPGQLLFQCQTDNRMVVSDQDAGIHRLSASKAGSRCLASFRICVDNSPLLLPVIAPVSIASQTATPWASRSTASAPLMRCARTRNAS